METCVRRASHTCNCHRYLILLLAWAAVAMFLFPGVVLADEPAVMLDVPESSFIGEPLQITVSFDNVSSDAVGYGPFIDLVLPTNGVDGATSSPQDGLTLVEASYLGAPLTQFELVFPDEGSGQGCVEHPLAVDSAGEPLQVCGAAGDTLYVFQLPYGSFTPDQPVAPLTIDLDLSNLADLGVELPVYARAGFMYGADPLDNPADDPSIVSATSALVSDWSSASVIPTLIELRKVYIGPEDETATGPNFPRRYVIQVDIADGQTVTDLDVFDTLSDSIAYLSLIEATPAAYSVIDEPTVGVADVSPNNVLQVSFDSVTGGPGDTDATVTFEFFVPQYDAADPDADYILPPDTADDHISENQARAVGDWDPIDDRDAGATDNAVADPSGPEHELEEQANAIQKSVEIVDDVAPETLSPGDELEYTLDIQISDFIAFKEIVITDSFSDGQLWDDAFTPTLTLSEHGSETTGEFALENYTVVRDTPGTGMTVVTFRLSDELQSRALDGSVLGGCVPQEGVAEGNDPDCDLFNAGATTGQITFRTMVQQDYTDDYPSGDTSLDEGDPLNNRAWIDGDVLDVHTLEPTGYGEDDDTAASLNIERGTLVKSVYAINGNTAFTEAVAAPGYTITYRLQGTLFSSDVEELRLTDYLPLPVLYASELSTSFTDEVSARVPVAGELKFGPDDTFRAITVDVSGSPLIPTVSINTAAGCNDFTITYGDFDDPHDRPSEFDILFTVTISDDPFADDLYLTNQLRRAWDSTYLEAFALDDIIWFRLTQPVVSIQKGVVATNYVGASYTLDPVAPVDFTAPGTTDCPRWAGTISSAALEATPIDSDVAGLDAGNLVTFAIVVENTGSAPDGAYDVVVADDIPTGMAIPGTAQGLNLCVRYGDGSAVDYIDTGDGITGSDLFGDGIEIVDDDVNEQGGLPVYDADSGQNIIIITYDLAVDGSVEALGELVNTATLVNYAGDEGAPNHVAAGFSPRDEDPAAVAARNVGLTKVITASDQTHTTLPDVAVGEIITYTVSLVVPEGQLTNAELSDTLDNGLALVAVDSIIPSSADVTTDAGTWNDTLASLDVSAGGHSFSLDLGTVTNTNRDDGVPETITVVYRAVVLNVTGNRAGTDLGNGARFAWDADCTCDASADDVNVVEPTLVIDKSASPTTADYGDLITFTLTVTNQTGTDATAAFDLTVTDTLPEGLVYEDGTLSAPGASSAAVVDDVLTATYAQLAVDQSLTVTFQARVALTSAVPAATLTNTAETTWTSLPGDETTALSSHNENSVERTGDDADPGQVNDYADDDAVDIDIVLPEMTKEITATDQAHTTLPEVAIGEQVEYTIVVTVPEGTSPDVTLADTLDEGLALIAIDSLTASASLITDVAGGFDAVRTGATIESDGSGWSLDFGTLTNSDNDAATDETITVVYRAVVLDSSANDAGDDLGNEATWTWSLDEVSVSADEVTIVEPVLTIDKSASPTVADYDDLITYTLTITNETGDDDADAFDLLITDAIPDGTVYESGTLTAIGSTSASVVSDEVQVTYDVLTVGQSVTITFQVRVQLSEAIPSTKIDNTAELTWTSLPDDAPAACSPYDENSVERTGDATDPGEGNDYADDDAAEVTIRAPQIAKVLSGTNQTFTTNNNVAIGEQASYTVTITVPEGTLPDVTFTDTLDGGLALVSLDSIAASAGVTTDVTGGFEQALADAVITNSGRSISMDFGEVVNSNSSDSTSETITIDYTVVVLNSTGNNRGTGLNNSAKWTWSTGSVSVSAANVTVVEPVLTIAKTALPSTGDYGDLVTFTIVITNTTGSNRSTAFDLAFGDTIPEGLTYESGTLQNTAGVAPDSGTLLESSGTITATYAELAVGASSTLQFQARLVSTVTPEETITNTGVIEWTSLPEDAPAASSSYSALSVERTGDTTDPGGSANDHRASDPATVTVNSLVAAKEITGTGAAHTSGTAVAIGETVSYRTTITVPEGVTPNLRLVDTLQAGLALVSIDAVQASSSDVTTSISGGFGQVLADAAIENTGSGDTDVARRARLNLGDITNSNTDNEVDETITVDYTVVVLDSTSNDLGDTLVNSAVWSWTDDSTTVQAPVVTIVEPYLEITKSYVSSGDAGSTHLFQLTITHTGASNTTAFDVVISDPLPAGTALVSGTLQHTDGVTPTSLSESGGTITATYGSLAVGESSTVQFALTVSDPELASQEIENRADVTWTSLPGDETTPQGTNAIGTERTGDISDPGGSANDYTDYDTASISADLSVNKDDSPDPVLAGDELTYTLTVTNDGPAAVSNAVLTDVLPGGVTYVSATPDQGSCAHDDGTITCTLGAMDNGDSLTVDVTVTVADDARGTINNEVSVSSELTDTDPDDNTDDEDTTVLWPEIEIVKTADQTIVPAGTTVTYTYEVYNRGNTVLDITSLVDDQCGTPTYVSGDDDAANGLLDLTETWTYTCAMAISTDTTNIVTVEADPTDAGGTRLPDNIPAVSDDDDAFVDVAASGIAVVKTATPTVIYAGHTVDYSYTVTNTGDVPLRDVTIVDDVCSPVARASGDTNSNGLLDLTETWTYVCDQALSVDTLNTVEVTGQPSDDTGTALPGFDPVDDDDTAEVDVINPAIQVLKSASDDEVQPGSEVTYTYLVQNTGDDPLHDIEVSDDLCSPVEYVSGDAGDSILAVGEEWTYTCTAVIDEDTLNTATAQGDDSLDNPVDDTDTVLVETLKPSIDLRKSVDQTIVHVGDEVTYTIEIENDGLTALYDVEVQDDSCGPLSYVSGDAETVDVLEVGEVWTYTCSMALTEDTTNTATVTAEDESGAEVDDEDTAEVDVIDPEVTIDKTAEPIVALPGESVTYTYTVTNTGDDTLTDVTVVDDKCAPVLQTSGGCPDNDCQLDPGEVWTYTCTTTVTEDTTNTATVTGDDSLGTSVDDDDTAFVDIVNPGIQVDKSVTPQAVLAGGAVLYQFRVQNTGDVPLLDVTLDDDTCGPVVYTGGDVDADELLDTSEIWTYQCSTTVSTDTTNIVTATGDPSDATGTPLPGIDSVTDDDTAFVDVVAPAIDIVKTADPEIAYSGEEITYTYAVTNTGDVPLRDIGVVDDTCTLVTADDDNDQDGNGLLDVDEVWTYTCAMALTEDTVNTAVATGQPADDTGAALPGLPEVEDEDTAEVDIINPALLVVKTPDAEVVNAGDTVTYTAAVTNVGDDPLVDVVVSDDHCGLMTYVSGDDGDEVLGLNETWLYECAVVLNADRMNTVTVRADDTLENPVVASDSAFVDVLQTGIDLRKNVDRDTVYVGDEVMYVIAVENTGLDPLTDVDVEDDHCSPLGYVSGDETNTNVLDPGEIWLYSCTTTLDVDTMNEASVTARDALDQQLTDSDVAEVNVIDPAIEITKTASPTIALAGTEIAYTYEVRNAGDDPLSDVLVTDDVCSPVLVEQGGDVDSDGLLDLGEVWRYTCTQTLTEDTTNTATASGLDSLGGEVDDAAEATVDIVAPAVELTKAADPEVVAVGDLVLYTIDVTNTGDVPLRHVVVEDDHCAPLLLVVGGDLDSDGLLDVDEVWQYRCTAAISSDTLNVATVSGDPADDAGQPLPGLDDVSAEDDAFVTALSPAIEVLKSAAPTIVYAGDTVTYTYEVYNRGDAVLSGVAPLDDTCGPLELTGGDVNANDLLDTDEVWTYTCSMALDEDTTNTVAVSGQPCDATGAAYDNIRPVTDEDQATVDVINPAVQIVKSASAEYVDPGDTVTYTYAVTNIGDDPLTDVVVDDDHCGFVTFETVDANGILDPSETWTYTCASELQVDTLNRVIVDAEDSLGNAVTDQDDAFVDVLETGLDLRKSVDEPIIYVGDQVVYTIEVENTGDDPLSDVDVNDDTCGPLSYISGDTANTGSLDPGEVWVYTCTTSLDVDTTNTATATALDALGRTLTDADVARVDVIDPDIQVVKSVDHDVVAAGDEVTYTYRVTNPGDDPLSQVTIADDRCSPLGLISGDANSNGKLDPSETWVYACCATITEDTTNTATVSGDDSLGNPVADDDTAYVEVVAPGIALTKAADYTTVLAGDSVTYTYTVSNTGETSLSNVWPSDDTCAPVLRYPGGDDGNGRLDPGETWTFACTGVVSVDTTNIATVSGQPTDDLGQAYPGLDPVTAEDDETVVVVRPGIAIVKTADPDTVHPEDGVTYTYAVRNAGDVALGDIAPADDTCGPLSLVDGDLDDDGLLDVGEVWTYTCATTIAVDTLNTVEVSGQPVDEAGDAYPGLNPVEDSDTAYVDVLNPAIALVKAADRATASVGETIVYSYAVTNTGDAALVHLDVTDDRCTPVALFGGDGNGRLDPGETWTYQCEYLVDTLDPDPLVNTATVVGYDALGLAVEASDDASVALANGSIGDYVWEDLNGDGVQDAWEEGLGGITVILTYADGTQVTTVTLSDGSYLFGNLPVGEYTVTLDPATIPAGYSLSTSDEVTVSLGSGENVLDADFGLHSEATIDLSVAKTDELDAVLPGQVVTYTLTISNDGEQDLTGIVVTDTIPDEGEYVALSASDDGDYQEFERQIVWKIASLQAGTSTEVSYRFRVQDTFAVDIETLTNTVAVVDDGHHGSEENTDDNTAEDIDQIDAEPLLMAAKTSTPAESVACGEQVRYTVVVRNEGTQDAAEVVFSDMAPTYTTLVGSVTTTQGTITAGNSGGDTVTVELGELAVGATATVTFVVQVDDTLPAGVDAIANQGALTTANGDPAVTDDPGTPEEDDPTETPVDAAPDLTIAKTDGELQVEPGDLLTYTLTVTNEGTQDATGVVVTDTVPANTTFVADTASDGGVYSAATGEVVWTIGALAVDEEITLSFQVTVDDMPALVDEITNVAVVDDDGDNGEDLNPDDNSAEDTDSVLAAPQLSATKVASLVDDWDETGTVTSGDTLEYTIEIVNNGNQDASGVILNDAPDDYTSLVVGSVTTTQGTVVTGNLPGDTAVQIELGTLPSDGGSATVRFQVTLYYPLPTSVTAVYNQGVITGDESDPVVTDDPDLPGDDDPTETPVEHVPLLNVYKMAELYADEDGDGLASWGDTLLYTIEIENWGTGTATDVRFEDVPDPNTSLVVGSVTSTSGVVVAGNKAGDTYVDVYLGDIAGLTIETVTMLVRINDELPAGIDYVENQGSIRGGNIEPTPTDDPGTLVPDDPTNTYVLPPTSVSELWQKSWFNADGTITISWATIAETNNAGFMIYMSGSADGTDAEEVTFIPSQAEGAAPDGGWVYTYTESTPDAGLWYYWVLDVDQGGGVSGMSSVAPIRALAPKMIASLPLTN